MREMIRDKDEVCKAVSCSSHGGRYQARVESRKSDASFRLRGSCSTGLGMDIETTPDASEAPWQTTSETGSTSSPCKDVEEFPLGPPDERIEARINFSSNDTMTRLQPQPSTKWYSIVSLLSMLMLLLRHLILLHMDQWMAHTYVTLSGHEEVIAGSDKGW